jgi:hypothetical protein
MLALSCSLCDVPRGCSASRGIVAADRPVSAVPSKLPLMETSGGQGTVAYGSASLEQWLDASRDRWVT